MADGLLALPIPPGVEPMEAASAEQLPQGAGWSFEPKWDGFRCLAFKAGGEVAAAGQERQAPDALLPRGGGPGRRGAR